MPPIQALMPTATAWPIVNLGVDHLVARSPKTTDDVLADFRTFPARYRQAGATLGLSGAQYKELLLAFSDGRAVFMLLPNHVNGMSGLHHSHVYVLLHVAIPTGTFGWRVTLADGTMVFVLQKCGNLARVNAVGSVSMVPGTSMPRGRQVKRFQRKKSGVLAEIFAHGRLYVAAAGALERIGASVIHGGTGLIATKGNVRLVFAVGQRTFAVNNESRHFAVAPLLHNHEIFVVKSDLAEALSNFQSPQRLHAASKKSSSSVSPSVGSLGATVGGGSSSISRIEDSEKANSGRTLISTSIGSQGQRNHGFIQFSISDPHNFNEFSDGQHCPESYLLSGAFLLHHSTVAVKVDYREDVYVTNDSVTGGFGNQYTRFATIDGGMAQTPVFQARQTSLDTRLLYHVVNPQIFVGAGYLHTSNNYGYPQLSSLGLGVEKLPVLRSGVSFYGSSFYYPSASGKYTIADRVSPNAGVGYRQQYAVLKYDAGLAVVVPHSSVYVYGGFSGDAYTALQNAPVNQSHAGPYAGLGAKL